MKSKKILSTYTIAAYCSDTTDVQSGIDEIREVITYCNNHNKPVPSYFYSRLHKLEGKMRKLGGPVEMLPETEFKGSSGAWVCEHDRNENVYLVRTEYDETICRSPQLDEAADPARVSANFKAIAAVPEMWNLLRELYEQLETHRPRFYKREHYLRLRQLFDNMR